MGGWEERNLKEMKREEEREKEEKCKSRFYGFAGCGSRIRDIDMHELRSKKEKIKEVERKVKNIKDIARLLSFKSFLSDQTSGKAICSSELPDLLKVFVLFIY